MITGPESSGKTTLAQALAQELGGIYHAEYAREYLEEREGVYEREDLDLMLAKQLNRFHHCTGTTEEINVHDTGPETFYLWSQIKYGQISPYIRQQMKQAHFDFTLLCAPDLPWEPDPLREAPQQEDRMHIFCTSAGLLLEENWRFGIVQGQDRLQLALQTLSQASLI